MADLSELAPALHRDARGYWTGGPAPDVSYPDEGTEFCFALENESFWFAHRNRVILEAVRRAPPAGALYDVGAGNGFVTAALLGAGYDAIAIEPDPRGAGNSVSRGVPTVLGTLQSAEFREGSAGGIGLFDVIEHVEEDEAFLTSMRAYLPPRGCLYITTPAYRWLWSDEDRTAGHFRRYTLRALAGLLGRAGFDIEYTTYFFALLPLPVFLVRTLRSRGASSAATPDPAGHRAGGSWMRRLVLAGLQPEVLLVRRGWTIPFGASCLAVARAR